METSNKEVNYNMMANNKDLATFWMRFWAAVIDHVLVWMVFLIAVRLFWSSFIYSSAGYAQFAAFMAFALVYFWLFEGLLSATPGKMAMRIRVSPEKGSGMDITKSLIRNALRVVDCIGFYLVGAIFFWSSRKGKRLGDIAAKTIVIKD